MQKKKTLTARLLVPLMLVVLFQGFLPFSTLLASGIKQTIERNAIQIDCNMVNNRRAELENAMLSQMSNIQNEISYMDATLGAFLTENELTMDALLDSRQYQQQFAAQVYPELLSHLIQSSTSGVYLILANNTPITHSAQYTGFYLRDSDPDTKTYTNSDLMLERGDKRLARQSGITLDTAWTSSFSFQGAGVRQADSFFYRPYLAALRNPDVDATELGYWSAPFVLEENTQDNYQMISYSVPLIYQGQIYGVLGTEFSVSYLISNYFMLQDLNPDMNAGYILAVDDGDGKYRALISKGSLSDAATDREQTFHLKSTRYSSLHQVQNAKVGQQDIYAVLSPLKLYSNNVPYSNTSWLLCGMVPENSIFQLGRQVYQAVLISIVVCAAAGMIVMILTARSLSRPVSRLVDSVRGGQAGLKAFQPSDIAEIDELHQVIETLTDNEITTANQLTEEKERYRIAVESSSDIFFTYREYEHTVEIVNSPGQDGLWNWAQFKSQLLPCFSQDSRNSIISLSANAADGYTCRVFVRVPGQNEGHWYSLSAKCHTDLSGGHRRIVGFLRDIHEQWLREQEIQQRQSQDTTTGLYRLDQGLERISKERDTQPSGAMMLIDLCHFTSMTQDFGLTFGDVLLSEFAKLLSAQCRKIWRDPILTRAGSDEFLIWSSSGTLEQCRSVLEELKREYEVMIRPTALTLDFHAGFAPGDERTCTESLLAQTIAALESAKEQDILLQVWQENTMTATDSAQSFFGTIISQGYARQLGLAALAMNLFDRCARLDIATDLIARLMAERFGMANLVITDFQEDFRADTLVYIWKPSSVLREHSVFRLSQERYDQLNALAHAGDLVPLKHYPISSDIVAGTGIVGAAIPLSDRGRYCGSVLLSGISGQILSQERKRSLLLELGTVIQNRMNRLRHDASAKAKSAFLARMSHEIRTPMNGIIGMTEIALQDGQSEQTRIECLEKVRTTSHYLLGLLNDILDMSKIESGKLTLAKEAFHLPNLLQDLHSVLDSRFNSRQQHYETHIDLRSSWFYGDSLRISQVLINLLGNAIKYSPENTVITLTVRETEASNGESNLSFQVRDQGIGIGPEDRLRIFQSFEQVDSSATRQQGTGLGLAISNRIVRMMGGSIELESQLGQGSVFSFTLRLPRAADPQNTEADSAPSIDLTGRRILVAEDNELNMQIVQFFLEELGCTVFHAANGQEALEQFSNSSPGCFDLILMDVMMPVMDGLEATNAIRALSRPDSQTIPIVALSANAFDEDIKRSLASGMNAHLSKPIEPEKLTRMLADMLGSK